MKIEVTPNLTAERVAFCHAAAEGEALANRLAGQRPLFVCVIASTDTALVPGVSAAGASLELIPYTAAADAEVLAHGAARCIRGVPCNPLGPPGPAIITLAALELATIPHVVVDAGSRMRPDAPCIQVGERPGGLISEGNAVPNAVELFAEGFRLGQEFARGHDYLVVGESVPGGTTTALALLLALGIRADGRVSSSLAANAHSIKTDLAGRALAHLDVDAVATNPLAAVATLGDPMQATVAGLAGGAWAEGRPVLLAGGTQMMAILALLDRLSGLKARGNPPHPTPLPPGAKEGYVGVATTRWVVEDPTADARGLMADLGVVPLLATRLSFADSRHPGLRRYEDFLVKEGVGAGGAAVAAALSAEVSPQALATRVEEIYDRLLGLADG